MWKPWDNDGDDEDWPGEHLSNRVTVFSERNDSLKGRRAWEEMGELAKM